MMAKQSKRSFPADGPVAAEHNGRRIAGTYSAGAGRITVATAFGSKTKITSRPTHAVAQSLLRGLAKEGRA